MENKQTKQGLNSFFVIVDQIDEHSKIVSTTVSPHNPQKNVPVEISVQIPNLKNAKTPVCYQERIEDVTKQLLREKCPNPEFFLVRIVPHSN